MNDLAEELALMPNAIRSQLTKLQRDNLVHVVGHGPSKRQPEQLYSLTGGGQQLSPAAYGVLVKPYLQLSRTETGKGQHALLKEVGIRIVAGETSYRLSDDPEEKIEVAASGGRRSALRLSD